MELHYELVVKWQMGKVPKIVKVQDPMTNYLMSKNLPLPEVSNIGCHSQSSLYVSIFYSWLEIAPVEMKIKYLPNSSHL